MKKLLLIFLLFISFQAFGSEEMYYCEDIDAVGFVPLADNLDKFKYVHSSDLSLLTRSKIKIDFDKATIATKDLNGFYFQPLQENKNKPKKHTCEKIYGWTIHCVDSSSSFYINSETLRYTHFTGIVDLSLDGQDPIIVKHGICKKF